MTRKKDFAVLASRRVIGNLSVPRDSTKWYIIYHLVEKFFNQEVESNESSDR